MAITKDEALALMQEVCKRLGYDPIQVSEIVFRPDQITVRGAHFRDGGPVLLKSDNVHTFALFDEDVVDDEVAAWEIAEGVRSPFATWMAGVV